MRILVLRAACFSRDTPNKRHISHMNHILGCDEFGDKPVDGESPWCENLPRKGTVAGDKSP
jgi:hypothetical protein